MLPPEPKSDDPNSTLLIIRLPNGNKQQRRFLRSHTLQIVMDYLETLDPDIPSKYNLVTNFPSKTLSDLTQTLEQYSLFPNAVLFLKEKDMAT